MRTAGGGSIIHISTVGALRAHWRGFPYDVTKGAINPMTRAMAIDLAEFNIRVNAIGPGAVQTEKSASRRSIDAEFEVTRRRAPDGDVALQNIRAELQGIDRSNFALIGYRVRAVAATKKVSIIAIATNKQIVPASAREAIVAIAAVQGIVPFPAQQGIVAAVAIQHIVARSTVKQVIALLRQWHAHRIRIAVKCIVSRTTIQAIAAPHPDQGIVATKALYAVSGVGADDLVVPSRAVQIESARQHILSAEHRAVVKLKTATFKRIENILMVDVVDVDCVAISKIQQQRSFSYLEGVWINSSTKTNRDRATCTFVLPYDDIFTITKVIDIGIVASGIDRVIPFATN
jgi:hypothetical protein